MTDRTSFLRKIAESPTDDTARLVFADWLDEQDDPRGEFIRVQMEIARTPINSAKIPSLLQRQAQLLSEHRNEWTETDRPFLNNLANSNHVRFVKGIAEFSRAEPPQIAAKLRAAQERIDEVVGADSYPQHLENILCTLEHSRGFGRATVVSPHMAQVFVDAGLDPRLYPDAWHNHMVHWLTRQRSNLNFTPALLAPLVTFLGEHGLDMNRTANIRTEGFYWDFNAMIETPTTPMTFFNAVAIQGTNPLFPELADTRDRLHEPEWRVGWEQLLRAFVASGGNFGPPEQARIQYHGETFPFSPGFEGNLQAIAFTRPQSVAIVHNGLPTQAVENPGP